MVVLVLTLGCGKDGGGGAPLPPKMDSPRATADAVAKAFGERSPQQALALMPTPELLKKHFECPDDSLGKRLTGKRDGAAKEFEKVPADMAIRVGEFDKQGTEEKLYKAGETYQGCKVLAPVTAHKSRLELHITKGGKTDYDGETWLFLKFGEEEKWYFFD